MERYSAYYRSCTSDYQIRDLPYCDCIVLSRGISETILHTPLVKPYAVSIYIFSENREGMERYPTDYRGCTSDYQSRNLSYCDCIVLSQGRSVTMLLTFGTRKLSK